MLKTGLGLAFAFGCLLLLLLGSSPAAAQGGCAWEDCWVCRDSPFGGYCWPVFGNGRLCCNEYVQGDTTSCRAFDYYCYGIIVRDVPIKGPDEA